jgi:hypothetical protein
MYKPTIALNEKKNTDHKTRFKVSITGFPFSGTLLNKETRII